MGKVRTGAALSPSAAGRRQPPGGDDQHREHNNEGIGQLTQVISNRAVNEVRVGYAFFNLANAT